jgi:hypothetical protein
LRETIGPPPTGVKLRLASQPSSGRAAPDRGEARELRFSFVRHLLRDKKKQMLVGLIHAAKQHVEAVPKPRPFTGTTPWTAKGFLCLQGGGEGPLLALIEELVERNLESARHFLEGLDGGDGVSIFNAGDVTTKQSGTFLDVTLGKVLLLPECLQAIANHSSLLRESTKNCDSAASTH